MKKSVFLVLAITLCIVLCACGSISQLNNDKPTRGELFVPNFTVGPEKTTAPEETTEPEETTKPEETTAPEKPTVPEDTSPELINGMRPEFKEAMDSYEAFYDEYCEFMTEYNENPTNLTFLARYGELLIKQEKMNKAFEAWDEDEMNNAELKYYLEVNNRVLQKLADVAG